MNFSFHKYQGTGNDFVMIDDRNLTFTSENQELIALICHRRFGVGADGLILIQHHTNHDFTMVYFNADGREGSMCGNGGRCAVAFARSLGLFDQSATFMATDGLHEAVVLPDGQVKLKMQPVSGVEQTAEYAYMNTGSPHYVVLKENLTDLDVYEEGRAIRYNERFSQEGTNVNFVEKKADNSLFVRTYERGVEDETYSCGTGVTASALALAKQQAQPIHIQTLGGNLQVAFRQINTQQFDDIYLIGAAQKVFEGEWSID